MKKPHRTKRISAQTARPKPERRPKFNLSDWIVMSVVILSLFAALVAGIYFGLLALVQNQLSNNSSIREVSLLDFNGFLFNRGSEILDLYVNKRSGVILFVDSSCLGDETCSEYIDVVLDLASVMRDDTPDIFLFDIGSANSQGDTNIDSALSRAKVSVFPTLVLVRDGIETSRYTGSDIEDDALYSLFINNNLIDEELLEELLTYQEE